MRWCIVREFFKRACRDLFWVSVVVGTITLLTYLLCHVSFLEQLVDLLAILVFVVLVSACLVLVPYVWIKRLLRDARRECEIKRRQK